MSENKSVKFRLFQFWNTGRAPDEVEDLMQSWADDPTFEYYRFTTETADAFIKANFDDRTLAAYRKCGVPAMQADFFRYCALYIYGGVYVDADTKNSGRLPQLLQGRKHGLLMTRETRVANDFLYVRSINTLLYQKVIERAVENVESEVSNNVWMVTGPGIMTKLRKLKGDSPLFKDFDFAPVSVVKDYVLFQHRLAYKDGVNDWRQALGVRRNTIFR